MTDTATARRPPGPAPLTATTTITAGGSLAWLAIAWAVLLVVLVGILLVVGVRDGQMDSSLWEGLGPGVQRWLALAAGVSMVLTFGPMLIGNGVTRARLAASAVITMVVVAVAGAVVTAVGFAIEDVLYQRNDWAHVLDDGSVAGGLGVVPAAADMALWLAGYFVSGWLIGIGFARFGRDGGVPLIVPSILPAIAGELLVRTSAGNAGPLGLVFRAVDWTAPPPAAGGLPLMLAVLALSGAVAMRFTREVPLRP